MAKATTPPPKIDPKAEAEAALLRFTELKGQKATADAEMKELKAKLEKLLADNLDEWLPDGTGTAKFDNGKLRIGNETSVVVAKNINWHNLLAAFPDLVEYKPVTSKVKGLMQVESTADQLLALGLSTKTDQKFEVEV